MCMITCSCDTKCMRLTQPRRTMLCARQLRVGLAAVKQCLTTHRCTPALSTATTQTCGIVAWLQQQQQQQSRSHHSMHTPLTTGGSAAGDGVMSSLVHPRRSVLYTPGSRASAIEKCRGLGDKLGLDGCILDLEDAVAPSAKVEAREQVAAAVQQGGFGRTEVIVRINALESRWGNDDAHVIARVNPDAIMLPKVETPQQVQALAGILDTANCTSRVWCTIETPRGVLNALDIAEAHPKVTTLVAGTSDLTTDLHAHHTPDRLPLLASLGHLVLAARAADVQVLDGVHLHLEDMDGFKAQCRQGRDMGFDGKTLIHPSTIAAANDVFSPTSDEVEEALEIVHAFQEAEAKGLGVVVVRGKLVENLHVAQAQRLLGVARALGMVAEDQ